MTGNRAEIIAGLRELASWLEAHPDVPTPSAPVVRIFPQNTPEGRISVAHAIAELRTAAVAIGVEPEQVGPHAVATRSFSGGVTFEALVTNAILADFTNDGSGHLCSGCGRLHHDEDLAGEGGEVAAPAGVSGAATGPDELVWVAAQRKGIDYHADNGALTKCGRSAMHGEKLLRSEATEFAKPCPRCYPDGAA